MHLLLVFVLIAFTTIGLLHFINRLAPALGLGIHAIDRGAPAPAAPIAAGLTIAATLHLALPVFNLPHEWHSLYVGILLYLTLGLLADILTLSAAAKFVGSTCILALVPVTSTLTILDVMRYWTDPAVRANLPAFLASLVAGAVALQLFALAIRTSALGGTLAVITLAALLVLAKGVGDQAALHFCAGALGITAALVGHNLARNPVSSANGALQASLGNSGSLVLGVIVLWLALRLGDQVFET